MKVWKHKIKSDYESSFSIKIFKNIELGNMNDKYGQNICEKINSLNPSRLHNFFLRVVFRTMFRIIYLVDFP